MLLFHKITNTSSAEFHEAMEIYKLSFPENERVSPDKIKAAIEIRRHELFIGNKDDKTVFMALLYPLQGKDFILFDYMATAPEFRNQGIGTAYIYELIESLRRDSKYLLMEVENPLFGENRIDRQRRVSLYQRLGAKIMKDVRYLLPPFSSDVPTEMILMILPAPTSIIIDGTLVRNLIQQVYRELYDRGPDDVLLNSILKDILEQVELI